MQYKNLSLYKALKELDTELAKAKVSPFELRVVGGFAMMLKDIRKSDAYTDIDYIGETFDEKVTNLIEEVGRRHGFEHDWINNDVMVSGSTQEDMEFATGKLHFSSVKTDFKVIKLKALEKEDLLRMKVIAIDTMLMSVKDGGGVFTRVKDFADIKALMTDLDVSLSELIRDTSDYVLENDTYTLIRHYNRTENKNLVNADQIKKAIKEEREEIAKGQSPKKKVVIKDESIR